MHPDRLLREPVGVSDPAKEAAYQWLARTAMPMDFVTAPSTGVWKTLWKSPALLAVSNLK